VQPKLEPRLTSQAFKFGYGESIYIPAGSGIAIGPWF
jgi:hypothetical protein